MKYNSVALMAQAQSSAGTWSAKTGLPVPGSRYIVNHRGVQFFFGGLPAERYLITTANSWRMTGDLMETCSCNVTCPCNFGGGPTQAPCEAIFGFHVQEGNYGSTPLNGLNLMLYARIPGLLYEGNWTLGVYLDDSANSDQAGALGTILSGQAGGIFEGLGTLVGNPLPPKQVPINYETVDGGHHFTVPGLAEIESERIPHPMPGQPALDTQVTGIAVPFYSGAASIRRAKVMKLTDPELSFEYQGSSSLIEEFDFNGP